MDPGLIVACHVLVHGCNGKCCLTTINEILSGWAGGEARLFSPYNLVIATHSFHYVWLSALLI